MSSSRDYGDPAFSFLKERVSQVDDNNPCCNVEETLEIWLRKMCHRPLLHPEMQLKNEVRKYLEFIDSFTAFFYLTTLSAL